MATIVGHRWEKSEHNRSLETSTTKRLIRVSCCVRAASSEFGTYRLCEQRRLRRACASAQSRQNLRCLLIQAVNQEEPSERKLDPWPLWMAGHAQLKFVMTECAKTQIRLTGLNYYNEHRRRLAIVNIAESNHHSKLKHTPNKRSIYRADAELWVCLCLGHSPPGCHAASECL